MLGPFRKKFAILLLLLSFQINAQTLCGSLLGQTRDPLLDQIIQILNGLLQPPSTPSLLPTEFGDNILAQKYVRLANQGFLLNQNDPRLHKLGLIVPNGGLCGPTCLVNTLGALLSTSGEAFRDNSDIASKLVVTLYNWRSNADARYGTNTPSLTEPYQFLLELHNSRVSREQDAYELPMEEASSRSSLMIASVNLTNERGQRQGSHGRHAIIILKIDPKERLIYVSDPNHPNQVYKADYWLQQGKPKFESPINYSWDGQRTFVDIDVFQYIELLK